MPRYSEVNNAFFRDASSLFPNDPEAHDRLWAFIKSYLGERVYFRKAPIVYFERAVRTRQVMRTCTEGGHLDKKAAITRTMRACNVSRKVARALVQAEIQTGLWKQP